MNEETLALGRMVIELTHWSDDGLLTMGRRDGGWRVRARCAGQECSGSGPTLLVAVARLLRHVLDIEKVADLVDAPLVAVELAAH